MHAMEISRTALDVEWRRLEIIAENLANANVAASTKGGVYRPLSLVSGPRNDFAAMLDPKDGPQGLDVDQLSGVAVRAIVASNEPPHLVHEPGNPLADANGFVAYPALDHAKEMTDMIETSRVYEANIVALNMARAMYSQALQIGARNT
jgi:flagellar basal-body rod protein FlgC